MNFYQIRTDPYGSRANRSFAYARDYGPLNGEMPFFTPSELVREMEYWKVNPNPPGMIISETGSKWPDFLPHGGSCPRFFVSERVIKSLTDEGIPIARLTEMPIAKIRSKSLRDKPAPRYFVLEADQCMEVDYAASGRKFDADGKLIEMSPVNAPPWKYKRASWTGADLFALSYNASRRPSCSLNCTDRIVDLAKRDCWTNVRFDPIETV